MCPQLKWDKLHLKAWSWLRSGLLYRRVHFGVECDLVRYENKVGIIERIHLLNLQGENSPKGIEKPSQKDHLMINAICIKMPT